MIKHSIIENPTPEQARKKAAWLVSLAQRTSTLEGQGVRSKVLKRAENRIVKEIMSGKVKIDSEGVE